MRKINKYIEGINTVDGAGVRLRRVFARVEAEELDPFLMMDFFDSENPDDYTRGFPWHPHRGIETVTYLVSGEIEHRDSIGSHGTIGDGDCQWMTAGSGILHQEMPSPSDHLLGVQLWLNLPHQDKMTAPKYRDIRNDIIPVVEEDDKKVHIIAGEYGGVKGPLELIETDPTFLDIELDANSEFTIETNPSYTAFAFLVKGEADFNVEKPELISAPMGVLYQSGDSVKIKTEDENARIFLLLGKPLNESIAWAGPIVMNTSEELEVAFDELRNDTFIK